MCEVQNTIELSAISIWKSIHAFNTIFFFKWSPCARNLSHSNIIIVIIIFISTFGIHIGLYSHRWESFMNDAHMCVRERAFKRLKIANKHLAKAKRLVNRSANKWNFVKKCIPLSIYLSCYICIAIIWLKMKAFIYWRLTKNRDDETIFGGFVWFFVCVFVCFSVVTAQSVRLWSIVLCKFHRERAKKWVFFSHLKNTHTKPN